MVLLHFIPAMHKGIKMPKKNVSEKVKVEPKKITEEDEARIIEKYFGCHPKYIRIRGTSVTIDVTGMAMDGKFLRDGLIETRSRV